VEKLNKLRKLMLESGLDAYIISSGDSHNNGYMPEYWSTRKWFSGFTGSSGLVVITATEAGLWTDGRYFIQAAAQLANTGIDLYKMGEPNVPTYQKFLADKLPNGGNVGFDGRTFSAEDFAVLKRELHGQKFAFKYNNDLIDKLWADRPPLPTRAAYEHLPKYAGLCASEKLRNVREEMADNNIDAYLVSALDDVAWLLNIRGWDLPCVPVVYAYVLITAADAFVFVDVAKVTDISSKLTSLGFTILPYEAVTEKLTELPAENTILYTAAKTNVLVADVISAKLAENKKNIIAYMKSQKTETELANIKNAYIKEGVATTRLIKWVGEQIHAGKTITEDDVAEKMTSLRSAMDLYVCDSFSTIAGYAANGALPHYRHEGTGDTVKPDGFLLVDTGGQYLDGTTDTTRTFAVGSLTDEMKRDFTLVLKGHIALSTAVFLKGMTGHQLDMLARQPILQSCQNYKHGTGHGIGYCLGVHEGPQGVAHKHSDVTLEIGMIISNEPAIYKEGRYGIRTENVLAVKELCKNDNGIFYAFDDITYCPYDNRAMVKEMLTAAELEFVRVYHEKVQETLAPLLTEDERVWLKEYCDM